MAKGYSAVQECDATEAKQKSCSPVHKKIHDKMLIHRLKKSYHTTIYLLHVLYNSTLDEQTIHVCKMIKSFSAFCFILLLTASCGGSEKKFDAQSYEKHKESLAEKEKKNPIDFLTVSADNKRNIIGQTVVRGKIANKATVSSYKDVRIKMLCYKDNKMVEEHEDVIDKIIKPNSSGDFKIKYRLPKGTDSIAVSVMSASIVQ
jgi:hypothetical protein